jgi:AraC-like DNA-binding protein
MAYLIRAACLADYVEVGRSVGIDPYRLLDSVVIPRATLNDPDMMISAGAFGRLLEASAEAAGLDDFGLRLAEKRGLATLGAVGLLVREQPTLRKALEVLTGNIRRHNQAMDLRLDEADDTAILGPVFVVSRPAPMRQAVELSLGVLYRILQHFLGPTWAPYAVWFTHSAPRHGEWHRRLFGATVEFEQDFDGIIWPARDLDLPVVGADPSMARYIERILETTGRPAAATWRDQTAALIREMLPSNGCSIDKVASRLDIMRRTLHRRLAQEGDSYSALLDRVRLEMAIRLLESPDQALIADADLLGFSGPSTFSRWFCRKFGCSPSVWRRARRSAASRSRLD